MSNLKDKEYKRFEDIKHIGNNGSEFWSARELAPALEYSKQENFHKVIKRAMIAIFQNAGYMGLYGGLDVDDIHKRKGLEVGQKILDYMGSTELVANLFRISQTEEKLRKDEITGAKAATATHYKVGEEVRGAIEKIGGTMPEDLPSPEKAFNRLKKNNLSD